jgi:hypothetical protein
MNNQLDAAVTGLLGLDPARTTVEPTTSNGCSSASTAKIAAKFPDGSEKYFFMKMGTGTQGRLMVEGIW